MKHRTFMYGHFCGGDPRTFRPDREVCTPSEIAAWEEACAAWSRGEQCEPLRAPYAVQGNGPAAFMDGSNYGVGIYEFDFDCDDDEECPGGRTWLRPWRAGCVVGAGTEIKSTRWLRGPSQGRTDMTREEAAQLMTEPLRTEGGHLKCPRCTACMFCHGDYDHDRGCPRGEAFRLLNHPPTKQEEPTT